MNMTSEIYPKIMLTLSYFLTFSIKVHHCYSIKPQGKTIIRIFNAYESIGVNKVCKEYNNGIVSTCWFPVRCYFSILTNSNNRSISVGDGENIKIVMSENQTKGVIQ